MTEHERSKQAGGDVDALIQYGSRALYIGDVRAAGRYSKRSLRTIPRGRNLYA